MTTVAITGTTNMTTASASSSSTTPPNVVGAGVVGSGGTTPPNNSQTNCTNALVGVVSSGTSSGLSQTSQQQQQGQQQQQQVQQQQQQQQQQQTQTQQQSNLNTSTNSCSSKNNSSSSINNSSGNGNVAATVSVSVSGSSNNSNNGNNNNSNSSNSSNSNTSSNNINNSNNNNSNSGNTSSSNNINNNNSSSNNNNNNSSNNSNNISSNNNGNSNVNISVNNNGNNSNNNAVGMMNIKEEPNLMDTSKPQIKREDESPVGTPPNMSGVNVKKEPIQRLNSNGSANSSGIIGSTNTGSLHHGDKNTNDASLVGEDSMMLGSKDDLMPDTAGGVGSINSIQSIKKEEPGPDLSPDGFSALGGGLTSSGNNMQTSGGNNAGRMPAGSSPSDGVQSLSSNLLGNKQSGGTGMDYMQQQNHIFVFSTQLANKGAESVLNGHFPTIIAYHRAQPGTKKFLEEFFLKNPLKLSKMNRQNPTQWMNNNMMMGGNKKGNNGGGNMNSNSNNSNNSGRMVSQPKPPTSTNTGFPGDDLPGGDPELMPWEQSGNHLGLDIIANGAGGNVSNAPVNENSGLEVDNLVPGSPSLGSNRSGNNHMPITTSTTPNLQPSPTTMTTSSIGPTSPSLSGGLQPSLQGVKVPDENLTPQQRQHREEQLAKLKKMNQFLFPEQGGMGPEFVGVPPEGDQSVPGPGKMMGGGGNQNVGMLGALPGAGPMQMQLQGGMPNVGSALRGSNMMGLGPRGSLCRPMGPMGPNAMQDTMMGGVPPNNVNLNDMPGMQCGMPAGVMSNQTGPGNPPMVGGNNNMGGMMGGVPPLGHQVMMQGAPMGPGGPMNPCAVGGPMGANMMTQNKHMMGGPGVAQMEWSKLQHQFYEERKVKGMDGLGMGMCPGNSPGNMSGGRQMPPGMRGNHQGGPRSQGPPPPYHQTPRSASVPIATQSPNPGSPNNPTSNLSLPSPRGGSTLNSPVGDHSTPVSSGQSVGGNQSGRQMPYKQDSPAAGSGPGGGSGNNTTSRSMNHSSNPSTPISSHLSPNASLKDLEMSNAGANCNQGKEPNLMPVPSPQQIQYLNTFEGQELTIQKQPNTSLKDGSIISPPGSAGAGGSNPGCDARLSGNTTPLTPSSLEPRFPPGAGGGGPVGNPSGNTSTGSTFPIPSSPQTPNASSSSNSSAQNTGDKNSRMGSSGPSPQGSRTPSMSGDPMQNNPNSMPSSVDSVRFPPASPGMNFSSVGGPNQGGNSSSQQSNQLKMAGFMDVSPNGKCSTSSNDTPVSGNFCGRADNMPLNPNSSCPPPAKTSHFDPISSLAQMSQQLTSSVSSSLNGQPTGVGPGPGGGGNPGAIMGGFQNHGGMGMGSDMSMGGHHVDGLMPGMDPCSMGGVMPGMGQYGMHGSGGGGLPPGLMGVPGPRSLSPKLGSGMVGFPGGAVGMPHRMIGRPPMGGSPYNGANIQVKASTPNTIQYLPARPQVGNTNPRAPPSLEFLQRFANPMSSMDGPNKVPSGQNMPFYPNCSQMGQGGPGGMGLNAHMDGGGGLGGGDGSGLMSMGGMGPGGPMMGQNMMMRGLRPPGQGGMVRMPGPSHMGGGGGHHHLPFSNGPPNGPNDPSMFPGNQMFSPGSKGSPMGGGGPNGPNGPNQPPQMPGGGPPDASQPLPPSMGGQAPGGSFKSSQFVGPSTADPNYAQQYHNFQQQLYATSTRSQMNNQPGGGGMAGPPNPNQPFFVPK